MIEQQGRVIRLEGSEAVVRVGSSSGCWLCEQGKGCGAGIFAQLLGRKTAVVRVENRIGARPGQSVNLGIPETMFLGMVLRLYLLPLLLALAGAALGHHIASLMHLNPGMVDLAAFSGAMVSFLAAMFLFRPRDLNMTRQLNLAISPAKDPQCGPMDFSSTVNPMNSNIG